MLCSASAEFEDFVLQFIDRYRTVPEYCTCAFLSVLLILPLMFVHLGVLH